MIAKNSRVPQTLLGREVAPFAMSDSTQGVAPTQDHVIASPTQDLRGWSEVDVDALKRPGHKQWVLTAGGLVWRWDTHLFGCATSAATASQAQSLFPCFAALIESSQAPLDVVSDVSRVAIDKMSGDVLEATYHSFGRLVPLYAQLMHRQAGHVAPNWASPYWKGLNEAARAPWKVEVFFDMDDAWAWLGLAPSISVEIDALIAGLMGDSSALAEVQAQLRLDPTLSLAEVARRCGRSARSLQRLFESAGKSFTELRSEVRMAHALAMLEDQGHKIEAIGRAIGFQSSGHFAAWFRKYRGISPSEHRARDEMP